MRMMLKAKMDTAAASKAIREGRNGQGHAVDDWGG